MWETLVINSKYDYCTPFQDGCAIALKNIRPSIYAHKPIANYGLINTKSEDILPPIATDLEYVGQGLYAFKINELYGLVSSQGQILCPNRYKGIGKFKEGVAIVYCLDPAKSEEKNENVFLYGIIDAKGKEVLPVQCDFIADFTNGFAVIVKNGEWGLFNCASNHIVMIPNVSVLGQYNNNLCLINRGGDDNRVNIIIKVKSSEYNSYLNYLCSEKWCNIGGLWGFVDARGMVSIEPQFEKAFSFSEGLAAVQQDGKWGYINTFGLFVVEPQFEKAFSFSDGLAAVCQNGKWGYINTSGQFVVEPRFKYAHNFSEGLAAVCQYEGWGYIDTSGRFVVKPQFEDVYDFSEEMAAVCQYRGWGFIDSDGEIVIPCEYDEVKSSFKDGECSLVQGNYVYIFNEFGEIIRSYWEERETEEPYYRSDSEEADELNRGFLEECGESASNIEWD